MIYLRQSKQKMPTYFSFNELNYQKVDCVKKSIIKENLYPSLFLNIIFLEKQDSVIYIQRFMLVKYGKREFFKKLMPRGHKF